jgi:16S rRNA (cytosine967-C5)-methyltransferase
VKPDRIGSVTQEFDQLGWRWRAADLLPTALQVHEEVDVTKTKAFGEGMFEVQDLGSQLLLESAGIRPGGHWLDACAGAGGKTLQLAQLLGPSSRVDAFDIRRAALAELKTRANRAGILNLAILDQRPTAEYDGVLVDAPCSGSGTWRRAPHLKWTTTSQQIAAAAAIQRTLLAEFSERVRPGGRLLYATCSLNQTENQSVVSDFLERHPQFTTEAPAHDFGAVHRSGGLMIMPALHNTDGFFIAAFRRAT